MSQYQQERHEFFHEPNQQQKNHPPYILMVYQRAVSMVSGCGPPARLVPVSLVVYSLISLISECVASITPVIFRPKLFINIIKIPSSLLHVQTGCVTRLPSAPIFPIFSYIFRASYFFPIF